MRRVSLVVVFLALAVVAAGCKGEQPEQPKPPPVRVTAVRPVAIPVQDYWTYNGYLETTKAVEVRSKIRGFLDKVCFTEGEEVAEGKELYTIDKREFETAYNKADAEVLKARADADKAAAEVTRSKADIENWKAQIVQARADLERVQKAVASGAESTTERDKAKATLDVRLAEKDAAEAAYGAAKASAEAAKANVKAAEAALRTAGIQLGYTDIKAKIAGRISRTLVDEGNLVLADTTVLTTIVRVDELYVYFDAPERDLVEYQRSLISAQGRDPLSQEIPVEVGVTGEGAYPHAGKIDFRDNRVDTSTGTIRIRGRIPNPPENGIRLLYPGMYARVRVPKGPPTQQQVIPEDCLMTSQEGRFIYVVGKDGKVGKRLVTVGATVWKAPPTATGQAARWYAGPDTEPTKDKLKSIVAISNKERPDEPVVKPDEWVILQGLQKTRPGDQVELDSWKLTRPDEAAKK